MGAAGEAQSVGGASGVFLYTTTIKARAENGPNSRTEKRSKILDRKTVQNPGPKKRFRKGIPHALAKFI